ncbi:MAG TPA: acetyl-CoA carboxylase carboxyl transferase subunit alpha [Elusimicrobia bacterium]|jgi:acetyl-CoA carboxylase carboxyl transferase subunit alpha|nr:acetyl-CoA carboxylase carboxyl transferase subunit alpha [Elusimicrobiota bacterium]
MPEEKTISPTAVLDFEKPIVELETKINELKSLAAEQKVNFSDEIKVLEEKCEKLKKEIYGNLTAWQKVLLARHPRRPYTLDYIHLLFTDFLELHGDRHFADDQALVGGMAFFENEPIVVIGHQKGRTVQENMERNFGMPHPEGYRKALRLMKLAEKFSRPIISFIDTPGAYPGIGAEERGQAEAIAENLKVMSQLSVPIIVIVIGEGGSGGALAISIGDRILMLENTIYSVISPEGCAAILFRDANKASEAAEVLKLTANDLYKLGIIDEIIPEPLGGAHRDYVTTAESIRKVLKKHLCELRKMPKKQLLDLRYEKFRKIGAFVEKSRKSTNKKSTVDAKE